MTYAQMKRKAAQHQNDLNGYCDHKSEFITSMTENRKLPATSLKSRTKAAEHLLERRVGDHGFFTLPARTFWSGTVSLVPAVPTPAQLGVRLA